MKRITYGACVLMVLIASMVTYAFAQTKHEFDKAAYEKIARKTIGRIVSGNVDTEIMIADMEELIEMGIRGCKEHMGEPETPDQEKKVMKIVIDNAYGMKSLPLDEIEAQWHKGGVLKAKNIDIDDFDHFSEVMCHYDAVVHPATAIIALKKYKKTHSEDFLQQAMAELAEVVEHMKHLE